MNEKKTLQDILASLEDLRTVKNGYLLLMKIDEITKQNIHINPTGLAKNIHEKELDEYKKDKKLYNRKLTDRSNTISRKCRELDSLGLIEVQKIKEQSDERGKYYILTEAGRELLKKYSLSKIGILYDQHKSKTSLSNSSGKVSDNHTEKIQEQIGKVISGIPNVHEYFVSLDSFDGFQKIYAGERLPFEDDILYSDLSNHLGKFISYEELQDKLNNFKLKGVRLPEEYRKAKDDIRNELQMKLNLEYDTKCATVDTFSSDLVDWVYRGITNCIESGDNNEFDQLFTNKVFELDNTSDGVIIRSGVELLMKVSDGLQDQKISDIRLFMTNIKTTRSFQAVNNFILYRNDVKKLREWIITRLSQELERQTFFGSCMYS